MKNLMHVTDYQLYNSKVKNNLKFFIGSDLHFSYTVTNDKLYNILQSVNNENPDYTLFCGDLIDSVDMIDNPDERKRLLNWLRDVATFSPTLISLGGHDYYKKQMILENGKAKQHWDYYYDTEFFEEIQNIPNVQLLDNQYYEDDSIYIAGITQSFEYYHPQSGKRKGLFSPVPEDKEQMRMDLLCQKQILENIPANKLSMAMVHSPVYLDDPVILEFLKEFDYFIAGHMHNGCVPPILLELWRSKRGFIAPNKQLFPNNERDTLRNQGDKLLINGPFTTFQECTGAMQLANILFPTYYSILEISNNEAWNQDNIRRSKKYTFPK